MRPYKFVTIFIMPHAHCYCDVKAWLFLNIQGIHHYITLDFNKVDMDISKKLSLSLRCVY